MTKSNSTLELEKQIAESEKQIKQLDSETDEYLNQAVDTLDAKEQEKLAIEEAMRGYRADIDRKKALKRRLKDATAGLSAELSDIKPSTEPEPAPVTAPTPVVETQPEPAAEPTPVVDEAPLEPEPVAPSDDAVPPGPLSEEETFVSQAEPLAPGEVEVSGTQQVTEQPKWRRYLGPLKDWHIIAWSLALLAFFVTFVVMAGVGSPHADKHSLQWVVDLMFYWIVPIAAFLSVGSLGAWIERKNASRQ